MKDFLLDLLVCPVCKGGLAVEKAEILNGGIEFGILKCGCGRQYPVKDGIPRFVKNDSYVSNFSFEWNRFAKTQLDSANGTNISLERFRQVVGIDPYQLNKGMRILEIGCGMGRFLEIAAKSSAQVVGIDLSFSVDAARANLKNLPNVHIVQADIFNLPLKEKAFDLVYSIGVLHHTPDPKQAVLNIVPLLAKDGKLAIWMSPKSKIPWFPKATGLARAFTAKMKSETLLKMIEKTLPCMLPFVRIPCIGNLLKGNILPICDYKGELPLNDKQLLEWSILDTFDLLSPKYLYQHSPHQIERWLIQAGLCDIYIDLSGIIARAKSK